MILRRMCEGAVKCAFLHLRREELTSRSNVRKKRSIRQRMSSTLSLFSLKFPKLLNCSISWWEEASVQVDNSAVPKPSILYPSSLWYIHILFDVHRYSPAENFILGI